MKNLQLTEKSIPLLMHFSKIALTAVLKRFGWFSHELDCWPSDVPTRRGGDLKPRQTTHIHPS